MIRDSKLWTWHVLTGMVILLLLGLHMVIMHLEAILGVGNPAGGHPVDWANVVARAKSVAFAASYVLLLGAALFHGLYGLRNILFELHPAPWLKRILAVAIVILGVGLFVVGSWAAVESLRVARAL